MIYRLRMNKKINAQETESNQVETEHGITTHFQLKLCTPTGFFPDDGSGCSQS